MWQRDLQSFTTLNSRSGHALESALSSLVTPGGVKGGNESLWEGRGGGNIGGKREKGDGRAFCVVEWRKNSTSLSGIVIIRGDTI